MAGLSKADQLRADQVKVIADILDDSEGKSLTVLAERAIDALYDGWGVGIQSAPPPPTVGLRFKVPWLSAVQRVSWMGERNLGHHSYRRYVWVTEAGSKYGALVLEDSPMWQVIKPSTKADPKGNADGWKVGDSVNHSQGVFEHLIIAVSEKSVLLGAADDPYRISAESNEMLKKMYTKEGTQ